MTSPNSSRPGLAGHPHFHYQNGILHAEDVPLDTLASQLGTPLYVYSRAALAQAWRSYSDAIGARPVLVCYGMKANSNLARSEEHTSELQSLMRNSYAVFCLKKKNIK